MFVTLKSPNCFPKLYEYKAPLLIFFARMVIPSRFVSSELRENVTMLDGLALSKLLIRVGILPTPVLV